MSPELLTATIVFTDVARSTAQRSALGDARADEIRRAHDHLVSGAIAANDGQVVKGGGDGFVARFGSAVHAVQGAVDIQRRIAEWSRSLPDTDVELRIGISSGDVSLENGDVFGLPVVEAARLESTAAAGEILCAAITRLLVGSRAAFDFDDRGTLELKGILEPVQAFAVDWHRGEDQRTSARLPPRPASVVGRTAELAAVEAASGRGLPVIVDTHAGGGKSTFLAEVAHRHAASGRVLFATADRLDSSPFSSLRSLFQPSRDELPGDLAERLWGEGPTRGADHSSRVLLYEGLREALVTLSTGRPTTLVVDDAHWIDDTSADALRSLVTQPLPGCTLVLGARCAEIIEGTAAMALLDAMRRRPGSEEITLRPLTLDDVRQLAEALDVAATSADLLTVHERSGGLPLFVAEMLLHDSGDVEVPASIVAFLARRLRELPAEAARVLDIAAVLPEPVDIDLLAAVSSLEPRELLPVLDRAEVDGLMSLALDGIRFRHVLVRDAIADRVGGHQRAEWSATALRHLSGRPGQTHVVADLAIAAGPMVDPVECSRLLEAAAVSSRASLAFEDAARRFRQAAERGDANDEDRRLNLLLAEADALTAAWHWGEARPVLTAACDLAQILGRDVDEIDAAMMLFGEPENFQWGEPLSERIPRAAEHAELVDPEAAARLLAGPMIVAGDSGDLEKLNQLSSQALALSEGTPSESFVMRARLRSDWNPDNLDARIALAERLIAQGEARRDNDVRAYGHRWALILAAEAGDLEMVRRHLGSLGFLANQLNHVFHRWFVLTRGAVLKTAEGDFDAADADLQSAVSLGQMIDTPYVRAVIGGITTMAWVSRGVMPDDRQLAAHSDPIWGALRSVIDGAAPDVSPMLGALALLPPNGLASTNLALLSPMIAFAAQSPELAQTALDVLAPRRGRHAATAPASAYLGSIDQQLGYCFLTLDRIDEAIEMFDTAEGIERAVGARLAASQSGWLGATSRRRRGDADGTERVDAAAADLSELGVSTMMVADVAGWS